MMTKSTSKVTFSLTNLTGSAAHRRIDATR